MKKKLIIIYIILLITFSCYLIIEKKSTPTITYFPIDYETSFTATSTSLSIDQQGDEKSIVWQVESKSEKPMYLRQDISLLFANGKLFGMRSSWRENTDTISFTEKIRNPKNNKWEAISFHYGEIHTDDTINSIQTLSYQDFYTYDDNKDWYGFRLPTSRSQAMIKEKLDTESKKELLAKWQDLLFYFHIDVHDYDTIPLTNLYLYEETPLPNFTQKETDRIMGQLWEGIYKNYVNPFIDSDKNLDSYIPLILIKKNGDTLLVLFEMNGEKEKLIQRIKRD